MVLLREWLWRRRWKGGSKSESSAAIHATAKWSTAQLKKTQAEQAARAKAAAEAQAKAKANRDALTQRLKIS